MILKHKSGKSYKVSVKKSFVKKLQRNRVKENFPVLLNDLVDECKTFRTLGDKYGVSRESIRLYYKKCLSNTLPLKTGRDRISECVLHEPNSHSNDYVKYVWDKLIHLGYYPSRVNNNNKRCINVNGKIYRIYYSSKPRKTGPTGPLYYHFHADSYNLKLKYDYKILVTGAHDIFIIKKYKHKDLFIPAFKLAVYKNHKPLIDWNNLRNNFELLN